MNPASVRGLLLRHGLLARRDLGQNFLADEALARRLVTLAEVGPADTVFEVGTGLGILTRALAAAARRVVTFEVDAGIVRALRAERLLPESVELHHADALRAGLAERIRAAPPPVRVVANLPYSIASPFLRLLLGVRCELEGWSVMVQREVAERLLAGPGSPDYGSLAVLHRLTVEAKRVRDLPPGCFFPAPKVVSSFLRVRPRADAPLRAGELESVERVSRAAFSHRRKTLVNALRQGLDPEPSPERLRSALREIGVDPRARAEELDAEVFLRLARALGGGAPDGEEPAARAIEP